MTQNLRTTMHRARTLASFVPDWVSNRSDRVENAELRLTWRCNARCIMCDIWRYSHDHDHQLQEQTNLVPQFRHELSTDEARQVVDQLLPFGLQKLTISGGEPTLRRDLADIVRHAADLGVRVHINSNGVAITQERAVELVAAGLQQINLSVDGPTREVHDAVRGDGMFDRTVAAMRSLKAAAATLGRPFHLHVHCVVMDTNYQVLDRFIDTQEAWGFDSLSFGPLLHGEMDDWQHLNTANRSAALTPQSIAYIVRVVAPRMVEKAAAHGLPAPSLPFGATETDFERNAGETYCDPQQWCTVAWFNTTVQPTGDIIPCGYSPNSMALGNVLQQPFAQIYNGETYQRFRASCKPAEYAMCHSCVLYMNYNAQYAAVFRTLNTLVRPFNRQPRAIGATS